MSGDTAIQYTNVGGNYVRCGQTVATVPTGMYDVVDLGMRGYGLSPKSIVSDDLIDLPGTVADVILDDIDSFMETQSVYRDFGLTHKRGYLMHGPGGTGKTSIGLMIARRFIKRTQGVVVFAPDSSSFYHGVSILREVEPGRPSMFLMEEVDNIVGNTHCLSILDGELSLQGAVFVAMTNYKRRLPKRITNRPGRFARVVLIDAPPEPIQVEYLTRLARRRPDMMNTRASALGIVSALRGVSMTMDHLREAFVSHVIMGEGLESIRDRFIEMAGSAPDGDSGDTDASEEDTAPTDHWEPSSGERGGFEPKD